VQYVKYRYILNELTLQNFVTNNLFWTKKVKTQQQQHQQQQQQQNRKSNTKRKQKIKHKNPCQSLESNLGPLSPQLDALHLDCKSTESIDCC